MLAQFIMSAISRSCTGSRTGGRRATDRRCREADLAAGAPWMQGEVVQLDAIGYSEDELIAREIKTHREAIALYADKATGSDAQMRVFARQILPQLQQHLAMLETLKSEKPHARR